MSEPTTPVPSDRAILVRQQAKANARRDGQDWSKMSKDERKILMETVRATMRAETAAERTAPAA